MLARFWLAGILSVIRTTIEPVEVNAMALHEVIERGRRAYPERTALIFQDQTWSYAKLDEIADRLAAGLLAQGLRQGDRVALLFVNCPEIVVGYYACFKAGLIAVPLNIRMKGPELAYVLNHSGARVLLGQTDLFRELDTLRAEIPALEACFLTGDCREIADVREFATLWEKEAGAHGAGQVVNDSDPAVILYTSGTTARPKGVVHSHYSLERLIESYGQRLNWQSPTVNAAVPPLSHMGSLAGIMLSAFSSGGALLLFPTFDPVALLNELEKHRVRCFWLVPVMYAALLQVPNISSRDLTCVELALSAGDTMPEPIRERIKAVFDWDVVEVCGMTECIYAGNAPGSDNRPGSIGKPLPGVSVRLVDDAGLDVSCGEVGEIVVKGEAMMCSYWQDPAATADAIRDGWLYTGDLARQDEDGYYWFVGRKKDIIIRGGSNVAPAEVEDALTSHPAVYTACVIGAPDPLWGQAIRAYVTLKPGEFADEATLKAYLQPRIAAYKLPETIRIVPSLPIGLTGKIHRQTLREWAATE
jgi:long-chain acyl-CoA synthetase